MIGRRQCAPCYKARRDPKRRGQILKQRYGITLESYDILLQNQEGKCAICRCVETSKHQNGKVKNLAIDHDHTTQKIRALLCKACNQALGLLRENLETATNLTFYIKTHKGIYGKF